MARYTGPNNKQARRVSFSILENGKDIAKRPYGPGQHGKDKKRKPSNYAIQLNEKQKVRFMYGVSEKQFKKLVNDAAKMKGVQGGALTLTLKSEFAVMIDESGAMAYHPYDEVFDIMQEVSELRKSIPLEDTGQGMQMNM